MLTMYLQQTQVGQPQTPQTPGPLRRQQAINLFDSDAEDDVDHTTKVEPGEMLSEEVLRHKCPYCPKVSRSILSESHISSHTVGAVLVILFAFACHCETGVSQLQKIMLLKIKLKSLGVSSLRFLKVTLA